MSDETDWDKALWMIDEGFTPEQLRELHPSDVDAWRRLKPMLCTDKAARIGSKEETADEGITSEQDANAFACRGVTRYGKRCRVKHHHPDCGSKKKNFCFMHCPCPSCFKLGFHSSHHSINNRGVFFDEVSE